MRPKKDLRLPRVVLVTRKTLLEEVRERRGTPSQARFYMEARGRSLDAEEQAHERFVAALADVESQVPPEQRRTRVDRSLLDRFLFASDDLVTIVGQDGLVANVAKYLEGQLCLGINPDPERIDGVLCRHPPEAMASLLAWERAWRGGGPGTTVERRRWASQLTGLEIEERTMAEALREDGQRLLALNEIFVGHSSHQSARYRIRHGERSERQSSSGLICTTGTGATGWARSIGRQRELEAILPAPAERRLVFFVREPFPSVWTGAEIDHGSVDAEAPLEVISEMGEGGVLFADGIEADWVEFVAGQSITLGVAQQTLRLVVPRLATS